MCTGIFVPLVLQASAILGSVRASEVNEAATDALFGEERIRVARRSLLILGLCGLVFGLLNLICCLISIRKALSDRAAIKQRNEVRRRAKALGSKNHQQQSMGTDLSPKKHGVQFSQTPEVSPRMNTVVEKAVLKAHSKTADPYADYDTFETYQQPVPRITHYFSYSPKQIRASGNPNGPTSWHVKSHDDCIPVDYPNIGFLPVSTHIHGQPPLATADSL